MHRNAGASKTLRETALMVWLNKATKFLGKGEQTRERILAVAEEMVLRRGFTATGIEAIIPAKAGTHIFVALGSMRGMRHHVGHGAVRSFRGNDEMWSECPPWVESGHNRGSQKGAFGRSRTSGDRIAEATFRVNEPQTVERH